jgi:WD40 repeat protein
MVVIICCFILDVLDLAWSANDSWLASCSVDNCIVVWNADKFPGKDVQDLKN